MGELIEEDPEAQKAKIRQNLKRALPDMDLVKNSEVTDYLYDNGFTKIEDLQYVQFEDIKDLMPLAWSRKLIAHWKQTSAASASTSREGPRGHSSYTVKWDKLPENMLELFRTKKALKNSEINELVRLVHADVVKTVPNCERGIFANIANDMAMKYPDSIKDIILSGKVSKNLTTAEKLKTKFWNRFDNQNRDPSRNRLQVEAPRRPEAYGCLRWQVLDLPDEETLETLEAKAEELKTTYQTQTRQNWDWRRDIRPKMTLTYCLQRRDINSQLKTKRARGAIPALTTPCTTDQIAEKWPFLFANEGMLHHFQELTGKDFKKSLSEWLPEIQEEMIDYLSRQSHENDKIKYAMRTAQKRRTGSDTELKAIILMLLKYFKEDSKCIMIMVQEPITMNEIEREVALPGTPIIVGTGKSWFHASKFYFGLDGKLRGSASTFSRGLGLLFCSYFVFNIKYVAKAAKTLDFIQRSIPEINPEKGSKAPATSRGKRQISFQLLKLNTDFQSYRERLHEGEDEEEEEVDDL
ncbi:hypothetical protein ONE63_007338 [Megalurothrips usitatus]|uniref:CARD domain-containing protein n=1 Tax=Megalurothrips usitatus TaxID=439358 RepID=A0AAV7XVZ7_9NEOP|nr:hypothetical protein ONE63_007338 [Megalurothrips usitatus]